VKDTDIRRKKTLKLEFSSLTSANIIKTSTFSLGYWMFSSRSKAMAILKEFQQKWQAKIKGKYKNKIKVQVESKTN